MDAFDFVLDQIKYAIEFCLDTEIFGVSIFNWIAGISAVDFIFDVFYGGDDGAD